MNLKPLPKGARIALKILLTIPLVLTATVLSVVWLLKHLNTPGGSIILFGWALIMMVTVGLLVFIWRFGSNIE